MYNTGEVEWSGIYIFTAVSSLELCPFPRTKAPISPSKCWKMTLLEVFESSLLTQSQINTIILGRSPCWKLPENNAAQKSLLNPRRPIDGSLNYAWCSGTIQVHTLVTWHLFFFFFFKNPEFILHFHSTVFFMCSIKSLLSLRHTRQFKHRWINVKLSVQVIWAWYCCVEAYKSALETPTCYHKNLSATLSFIHLFYKIKNQVAFAFIYSVTAVLLTHFIACSNWFSF